MNKSPLIETLGDFLADYFSVIFDIESTAAQKFKRVHSVRELRIMHMVFRAWRHDTTCTVTHLARETGISKTTVSRAVTSLMTAGLLTEVSDPEDGRRRLLLPTEKGREILESIDIWFARWAARFEAVMQEADGEIIAPEPAKPGVTVDADPGSDSARIPGQADRDAASR